MRSANSRTGMLDRTKLLHVLSKCANLAACTRSERDQGSRIIHAQLLLYVLLSRYALESGTEKACISPWLLVFGFYFKSLFFGEFKHPKLYCPLLFKDPTGSIFKIFHFQLLQPGSHSHCGGFLSFLHPGYQQYFTQYFTAATHHPHWDTCTLWSWVSTPGFVCKSLSGLRWRLSYRFPHRSGDGTSAMGLDASEWTEDARQWVWKCENRWLTASEQN